MVQVPWLAGGLGEFLVSADTNEQAQHMDHCLKWTMRTTDAQPSACYVQPPIGKFVMHATDTVGNQKHVHFSLSSKTHGSSGGNVQADDTPRLYRKFEEDEGITQCSVSWAKHRRVLRLPCKTTFEGQPEEP